MGSIATIGLDGLISDMAALATLPDSVIDAMLTAEADVIEPEQKKTMLKLWTGKYRTGDTAASVKRTKIRVGKNGRYLSIYPQGTNADGVRNAEVAFMNEFGTKGNRDIKGKNRGKMPARPAIDTANKNKSDQATAAAAEVYNTFVASKNL